MQQLPNRKSSRPRREFRGSAVLYIPFSVLFVTITVRTDTDFLCFAHLLFLFVLFFGDGVEMLDG
ncbi:hypothetical protein GE21DRAFT_1098911 [Neurospora crassa]|nr:hypothetical protein GE21DRAFT_1098911 [Neurospora crassa]